MGAYYNKRLKIKGIISFHQTGPWTESRSQAPDFIFLERADREVGLKNLEMIFRRNFATAAKISKISVQDIFLRSKKTEALKSPTKLGFLACIAIHSELDRK